MERVVFIVEATGVQIPCLLNPESLLLQRISGVETRTLQAGIVTAQQLTDDPILFTGGGTTWLTLNLLFDVNLPEVRSECIDVRELSGPLWQLAENSVGDGERKYPALTRLIWGKAFNFPCVVKEIAERLEYFTAQGTPQRAYIRVKLQRVPENADYIQGGTLLPPALPEDLSLPPPTTGEDTLLHTVIGAEASSGKHKPDLPECERLDQLAFAFYGDPTQWRMLAWMNGVDNPLALPVGSALRVPRAEDVGP